MAPSWVAAMPPWALWPGCSTAYPRLYHGSHCPHHLGPMTEVFDFNLAAIWTHLLKPQGLPGLIFTHQVGTRNSWESKTSRLPRPHQPAAHSSLPCDLGADKSARGSQRENPMPDHEELPFPWCPCLMPGPPLLAKTPMGKTRTHAFLSCSCQVIPWPPTLWPHVLRLGFEEGGCS